VCRRAERHFHPGATARGNPDKRQIAVLDVTRARLIDHHGEAPIEPRISFDASTAAADLANAILSLFVHAKRRRAGAEIDRVLSNI